VIVVAARLLLAVVFAVAGLAKLADRSGTRRAVVAFGAPARVAGILALALPLAELAVAGLLLPAATAVLGALGAVALLALFGGALAWNLARGRAPDCHCFRQLHSSPASWRMLARNGALLAVAVFALVGSSVDEPPSAVAWIGDLGGAALIALVVTLVACVVIVVGTVAFLSLMRSYGQVLRRLDRVEAALSSVGLDLQEGSEVPELGLAPGTRVPEFAARSVSGEEISRDALTEDGLPTLLLFTRPRCAPCTTLLPAVAGWQREHAEKLSIVVAISGAPADVRAEAAQHGLENVLVDEGNLLYELFEANGTPSAVLIAPDGRVASWIASGSEWIEQLVAQVLQDGAGDGLPPGTEAPTLELTSLDGAMVSLADLHGRDSLLLFWNPGCGFCRSMHQEVLAWEASANGVHPRLVIVSSGDAESTRAESFRSLVLLDGDFAASSAFGANGTPMAVLVHADGRIASHVVAGAEAVLKLANARATT
jgi:thiol-disulfide isomerase/thioredoxin